MYNKTDYILFQNIQQIQYFYICALKSICSIGVQIIASEDDNNYI